MKCKVALIPRDLVWQIAELRTKVEGTEIQDAITKVYFPGNSENYSISEKQVAISVTMIERKEESVDRGQILWFLL